MRKAIVVLLAVSLLVVLGSVVSIRLQSSEAASIPGDCDHLGCTQRFVEAPNGVSLAVKEFGNPDDPAIMLIHGFSQSHLTWTHQFEDLVNQGFRVVAWDYPGHGDSDKPTDLSSYETAQVWSDYVEAVIDDLYLGVGEQVCLVGHSLGGRVIDDYIFYNGTAKVAGVVHNASGHRFDVGFPQITDALLAIAPLLIDQELSVRLQATKDFNNILTLKPLPSEEVRDINMYNMLAIREAVLGQLLYINGVNPPGYDETVLNRLASVPILFIHGKEDAIVTFATSEASLDLIQTAGSKDVKLITLKNVGHSPHFEAQDKFNKRVGMFCGSHLGGN